MKIAILSTLSEKGSTVSGRVLPLAELLAVQHDIHLLWPTSHQVPKSRIKFHPIGVEPFLRRENDKDRLSGSRLLANLFLYSVKAFLKLRVLRPDVVIISKTHPQNILAAWLYNKTSLAYLRVILDVDDFELMANRTTSFIQRAAIHWAEHTGSRLANHIITATPFLSDHFDLLTSRRKPVTLVPTGISAGLVRHKFTPAKNNNLLYIGSVSEKSGHLVSLLPSLLFHLRQKNIDARLIMAGSGDDVEKIKSQFKNLNLLTYVTWHGRFTAGEVPGLVSNAALLVDPINSGIVARAKSSYRVLLAAASGLPVITSNIGIRPLLLPRELHPRFFATPADAKAYAELASALLENPLTPSERHLLTAHARQFTWEELIPKITSIIHRLT